MCDAIKKAYPDRELIVISYWAIIFDGLNCVHKCLYPNVEYFYHDYIEGKDSIVFAQDPYRTSEYINGKHLIQSWIEGIGLSYNGEEPSIKFDALTLNASNAQWANYGTRPYMVLQTNGGAYNSNLPYSWDRDIPMDIAQQIVNRYKGNYHIYHVTNQNGYVLHGVERVVWQDDLKLFLSILIYAQKRVLIDSSLQHAKAMGLPSVVLWNLNDPSSLGYDIHINIKADLPLTYRNRYAILSKMYIEEVPPPCPYEVLENIFEAERVFDAIDKL